MERYCLRQIRRCPALNAQLGPLRLVKAAPVPSLMTHKLGTSATATPENSSTEGTLLFDRCQHGGE